MEKIQWKFIIRKRRFSQSLKHGRYYWCRLHARKKNYDLYVQSDTILLGDVHENFQNTCLGIYELDPACVLTVPGLARQTSLNKDQSKIRSLNWHWYVINIEKLLEKKCITKANKKYRKDYDKNKESSYL